MQACSFNTDVADIVREMRRISHNTADQTKANFGDPFGKLTDEQCSRIADEIVAGRSSGFVMFGHGMMLTWTKTGGRLLFDVSTQGEHFAAVITAIHEMLKKRGLMALDALLFE